MNIEPKKALAIAVFIALATCLLVWPLAMKSLRTAPSVPEQPIDNNKEVWLPPGNWPPPLSEEEFERIKEEMRRRKEQQKK